MAEVTVPAGGSASVTAADTACIPRGDLEAWPLTISTTGPTVITIRYNGAGYYLVTADATITIAR